MAANPTLDPRLIAVSLANHLTPGMIATWNPAIARTPRVMVPIELDALVVRKQGGTWADVAMTAPDAGSSPAAHELLAKPFAERDPRQPGVYLHWALPDALTRGSGTAASGDVSFPAVPDRWVVLRLSSSKAAAAAGRRGVTGWVIEAGDEQPTVTPLDSWSETADPDRTDTPGKNPLTALGYGDTGWSAYFDNVENRLGFYDDLTVSGGSGDKGEVTGPLAYLVCGWHSRHIDDPIGPNLRSPSEFEARLQTLGWEINPADIEAAFTYAQNRIDAATSIGLTAREARFTVSTDVVKGKVPTPAGAEGQISTPVTGDGAPAYRSWLGQLVSWPEFTMYHGAVVGLGWPDLGIPVAPRGLLGGEVGGPPDAANVTVTIGNTLTEALAARLATNQGQADEARILEAVLLGGTDELDQPDAPARIDSRLHASGFAGLPGGVSTQPLPQTASVPPTSVVADPSQTDPGVFGAPRATPQTGTGTINKLSSKVTARATEGVLITNAQRSLIQQGTPRIVTGLLDDVLKTVKLGIENVTVRVPHAANADPDTTVVAANRALPRFFVPADPVFLVEGGGRAFKHGHDGQYAETGKLVCRLSGHTVTGLAPNRLATLPGGSGVRGEDLLERGVDHGGVPVECDDLLRELVLLDPGSATTAAVSRFGTNTRIAGPAAGRAVLDQVSGVYATEQLAWHISRDDRRDLAPLLSASGFAGTLPSPIAISLPTIPWVPLHLDWEVDLFRAEDFADWQLEEIDFDAAPTTPPPADATPTRTLSGRALLTGGAAQVAAATVRKVLEQAQQTAGSVALTPGKVSAFHSAAAQALLTRIGTLITQTTVRANAAARPAAALDNADQAELDHIADALDGMDVLVGAMDRFNSMLRSGFVADGVDAPPDGQPVPDDFWPLRSGFLKVKRLRMVDCFGQVVDLAGSSDSTPVTDEEILHSEPLEVDQRPDLVELAPRFTAPTRLWFRFVSATGDATEATDDISPVCGFVLPNHLDGDLQFYAADGTGLGAVRFDGGVTTGVAGVLWEDSPGTPTNLGAVPSGTINNPHLAGIAQGLLDWGLVDASPDAPAVDTALSSLLRIIDASLWAVDPFGHIGEEHLALLVGHPVAVLRALVRVEVAEPVTPDRVSGIRVPVRIGAPAHWQDGLLGYFVGDDYRTLRVPDPASADFARPIGPNQGFDGQATTTSDYYTRFATDLGVESQPGATPVEHPYVDGSGILWVQPGQDVWLTLLMEPHSVVHATTGFLPRKEIGMRRGWVAPGLSKLAPIFRFGPVLVDPKLIRMPIATDIRGSWSWNHRADANTWAEDPVTNSIGDARIPADPSEGQEGWLKLSPEEPTS